MYTHIWGGGIFEFNKVLSIIIFLVHALAFYFKNCCHTQCHVGFLLLHILNTVLFWVLHSRSIFHFELIFVKDVRSVFRVPFTWCLYWVVISSFFIALLCSLLNAFWLYWCGSVVGSPALCFADTLSFVSSALHQLDYCSLIATLKVRYLHFDFHIVLSIIGVVSLINFWTFARIPEITY